MHSQTTKGPWSGQSQLNVKQWRYLLQGYSMNRVRNYIKFGFPLSMNYGGHGGRVVTLWPPTSEAEARFPAWPQVGKLVVPCRWSAVYSTEP